MFILSQYIKSICRPNRHLPVWPIDQTFLIFYQDIQLSNCHLSLDSYAHRTVSILTPSNIAAILHANIETSVAKSRRYSIHRGIILGMVPSLPTKEASRSGKSESHILSYGKFSAQYHIEEISRAPPKKHKIPVIDEIRYVNDFLIMGR